MQDLSICLTKFLIKSVYIWSRGVVGGNPYKGVSTEMTTKTESRYMSPRALWQGCAIGKKSMMVMISQILGE